MGRLHSKPRIGDFEQMLADRLELSTRTVRRYLRSKPVPKPAPTEQLKPWIALGISRRTWYRRRKREALLRG